MKAVITLDEYALARVEIDKDGAKRVIHVDMQELAQFIVSSVKEDVIEVHEKATPVIISPTLPPNTIKYSKLSDDMELFFLYHPETKANVTYHQTIFHDVPFPNLVFCFGVRSNRLVKSFVMAYKDRFLRDTTELFRFPFANVYVGGKMCYHSNEVIEDLVQLQTFPHNWMHMPFNDHLYNQGDTNLLNQSLREILETSQGHEFNYDMLRPLGTTFAKWSSDMLLT